jgi:GTP-binding protein Era
MTDIYKSGFVSIVGRPNSGKSTLLNALVGAKLAIVADRPQTTRSSIQGVLTLPGAQVVFVDTPGIHKPDSAFNKRMMDTVRAALQDRDLLLYVADAVVPFCSADEEALTLLGKVTTPVLLLLNKVDRLKDKGLLLPLIDRYRSLADFAEYLPISALARQGLDELRRMIVGRLPEGPAYFPEDHLTDQPERFMACELIREKIIRETRQEVPHAAAVLIDHWEETGRLTRISATIYVERDGQKGILIGAGGATLKRIGTQARREMELLLGRKIFLELFVKVRPHWRENPAFLNELDWRSMAGGKAE